MDSKHTLEIVSAYTMDGRNRISYWQWRNGRCVANGTAANAADAEHRAEQAFKQWAATQGAVAVPA